jgi:hypothetical protein
VGLDKGSKNLSTAMLIMFAVAMHVMFCEYRWKSPQRHGEIITLTFHAQSTVPGRTAPATVEVYSGLFARYGVWSNGRLEQDSLNSTVWGIFIPAGLLCCSVILVRHWKRTQRRQTGHCIRCAHDLTGRARVVEICPECGLDQSNE